MDETPKSLLIIFYRNPVAGKVKTRLAQTLGPESALAIFRQLSLHTRKVTQELPFDKIVFYSDSIDLMDMWPNSVYLKALQQGQDLGERMKNSFKAGFETGYQSICIIGTDCYELGENVIIQAFDALKSCDAVIGPARDGGYYLLGLNEADTEVFENKPWSTSTVFEETVGDFEALGLKYHELPLLRDIDTEDDLPEEFR